MPAPLAVTMGDPFGIGIEICLKAWLQREVAHLAPFFIVGDAETIIEYARKIGLGVPIEVVEDLNDITPLFSNALPVLDPQKGATAPAHTIAAIDKAVELCRSGAASAMVTAPIQKKRLYDAGFKQPGHTEYLAEITNCSGKEVMMLACSELRVVPATIHIPIAEVPRKLTAELLEKVILTTSNDLKSRFGISNPRLAIAGLNPHAGEGGSIGEEDEKLIRPLVEQLANQGMALSGPHSADTLFHKAARETYDAAICMYHDQALIPIKTIDFDGGVNITLGLPIIRTSPDHGTADDIADMGIANPASMIAAIKMASQMAEASGHYNE
ncbi:4-hydroxythreonine-4-phosphate dehydrogenase PdxA [Sneathiella sp. P13V-1]|uniref:4-hydroxythreonine-4-phosphate dehydrogenase PdxA n=1 Tax=Sneathiella sp. P13V-1 TaxID=2697366 RepID=UPI00187BA341|nr:4-hydroxythreonine-4-phosphate dehydrogenase PdxA [Sneathiella sp. P13V-1]MBE7637011.1 4-hydroxythreonine-4-phosphate dehydrogenase PdxA [Sneathiella sp. P13V-1]